VSDDAPGGGRESTDRLFERVYDRLRTLASGALRGERAGHTLQTTALVHEAYVRLSAGRGAEWQDRGHFFGVAARAMRQVLVDHARRRDRLKRGGGWRRTTLDASALGGGPGTSVDVLDVHRALARLAAEHPDLERIVEMRFFAGLENREVAEALGVSERTIERHWRFARAWLLRELEPDPPVSE
jgi:RNA polymerase sigma factor (TIGR02999 family)